MAVGKNKRISKGKKGTKKKATDPFLRKEWFDVKAPAIFTHRRVGWSAINKTQGQKIASEQIKGRVLEANLADLNKGDEDQNYRKIKLKIEEVQGKNALTNFHGMDFTTHKLRSLVMKWQTLIEAHVDVNTTDGYRLRLFAIGFTTFPKKRPLNLQRKICYAQTSQVKAIRKKMFAIMTREASSSDLKDLVQKFIPNTIGKQILKECESTYPLKEVHIRKVKILKAPKFDASKLMEIHEEAKPIAKLEDTGVKV